MLLFTLEEAEMKTKSRAEIVTNILDLIPNNWNPNVVDQAKMVKLRAGIIRLLKEAGTLPPIVVRPYPKKPGKYQIIDGFHRWKILQELGKKTIRVTVLNVKRSTAKILTSTLNYLRGDPDSKKYSELVAALVSDDGMKPEEIAVFLPEDENTLRDILESSEAGVDAIKFLDDSGSSGISSSIGESDEFVDLKFTVATSQASVIEQEVDRIESMLTGKNRRGRALEYMAVLSSQTPVEDLGLTIKTPLQSRAKAARIRAQKILERMDMEEAHNVH